MSPRPPRWPARFFRQLAGKMRRFFMAHFRRQRVDDALARRYGNCTRCGACCKLLFRCPFLRYDSQGLALCAIYQSRPLNCRIFPLDSRDLHERGLVPGVPVTCGYRFRERASDVAD